MYVRKILGLSMVNNLRLNSTFFQIYGSLTLGLSMVGYMMMCYGTCQLATLLVVEKLHFRLRPMVAILNGNTRSEDYNASLKLR